MSWRRLSPAGLLLLLLLLPGCSQRVMEPNRAAPSVAAKAETKAKAKAEFAADLPPAPKVLAPTESKSVPPTPDVLVDRAEKQFALGDLEGAIRLLEQALAARPDHRKGLYLLALTSEARAGEMEPPLGASLRIDAAKRIRKLRDTYTDLTTRERQVLIQCLFNEACTYALGGQPEKAVDTLAEAVDAGLDAPEVVAAEVDFLSIRKLPRYAELLQKLEETAGKLAAGAAKRMLAETVPFAFHFELPSIEGKTVNLKDLKGKVVLVDFWGNLVSPCRKELPHFKELLAKYRNRGLTMIGINYERAAESDVQETIRQFVAEHDVPFTCLIGDQATRNQVPGFNGYPTLVFLDRSQKVRAKVVGYRPLIELQAIVELLLDEAAKSN